MEWVGTYTDSVEGPFYREVAHFASGTPPGHQLPGRRHERPLNATSAIRADVFYSRVSMSLPAAREGFLAIDVLKWGDLS